MNSRGTVKLVGITIVILIYEDSVTQSMPAAHKRELKENVLEMFRHAYGSYMQYAFPADELMPLSCKGRYRGTEPSRGDIDDSLGNFTLTLIDSLDTLAVLGEIEKFETAVQLVIQYARFESDIIVSVFETNIRILGGLLGGHVVATYFKRKRRAMEWYNGELLNMARDVGYRLLPAFNTTTGIPYPRINLKYGMERDNLANRYKDTCTACAGTMILEFAALSRLTGDPVFEQKAHKVMDYLWKQRHSTSDLVGTVINVHNGDWIRREAGVGAGIDSYYEYVLKAYVLLGDETYLYRFDKHYSAIMKYMSKGPMLVDVHMHKPTSSSRHFMDSLLAFWPGLQVLKGDISPAIKTHEMLYQLIQKHNFLPEAFTTDFKIHWAQHPLRPEFVESTYFLYKATHDPHYLQVGKLIIENLNKHARVPCGFAAIKDVTSGIHEDQLDSFVLAETFKYLYLLFSEERDLEVPVNEYLFTTEAHLLPLSLSLVNMSLIESKIRSQAYDFEFEDESKAEEGDTQTCPNPLHLNKGTTSYAFNIRTELKDYVKNMVSPSDSCLRNRPRLRAADFLLGNAAQQELISRMGIKITTMADGRLQLLHSSSSAASKEDAEEGLEFMKEMIELSKNNQQDHQQEPMAVQFISAPYNGSPSLKAGPAQFGYSLKVNPPILGQLAIVQPYDACGGIQNPEELEGKIGVLERGRCMFVEKARNLQKLGAIGGIVIDNNIDSTSENSLLFAMSGDGQNDIKIPLLFLFHKEGQLLLNAMAEHPHLEVLLSYNPKSEVVFSKDQTESQGNKDSNQEQTLSSPTNVSPGQPSHDQSHMTPEEDTVKEEEEDYGKEDNSEAEVQQLTYSTDRITLVIELSKHEGEDVMQLIYLPNRLKHLMFHLYNTIPKRYPDINRLYISIVEILRRTTNFPSLENQEEYLIALARLLEAAVFRLDIIDRSSVEKVDRLTDLLKFTSSEKGLPLENQSDSVSQTCSKNVNPFLYYSKKKTCEPYVQKIGAKDSIKEKYFNDGL